MTDASDTKIEVLKVGGRKLGFILQQLLNAALPNIRLDSIDRNATELIRASGGSPSFRTVKGYSWATCLCVNDAVVHGVPTDRKLAEGDIFTIDIGMVYKGYHTDTAWTKVVTGDRRHGTGEKERFLRTGEEALKIAIEQAKVGNRIGHISQAIQTVIEGAGYSIVKTLVGHGIGRKLHEAPQIPGFVRGNINRTPRLVAGMTLAIEVIYARGSGAVSYESSDGWTIRTRDASYSAVFEHTIAILANGPLVLTGRTE
jgi:methionyl aminopeptidase